MTTYVMEVDKIAKTLRALGLVKNEKKFSEDWLGKNGSYFSSKKATKCNVGVPALSNLYKKIAYMADRNTYKAERFNDTLYRELDKCKDTVAEIIRLQVQQRVSFGEILYLG